MWYIYGKKLLTQSHLEFETVIEKGICKSDLTCTFATPYNEKDELKKPVLIKKSVKLISNFTVCKMETHDDWIPTLDESIKINEEFHKIVKIAMDSNGKDVHIFTSLTIMETDNLVIEELTKQLYNEHMSVFIKKLRELHPEVEKSLNGLGYNNYSNEEYLKYFEYFTEVLNYCWKNNTPLEDQKC